MKKRFIHLRECSSILEKVHRILKKVHYFEKFNFLKSSSIMKKVHQLRKRGSRNVRKNRALQKTKKNEQKRIKEQNEL